MLLDTQSRAPTGVPAALSPQRRRSAGAPTTRIGTYLAGLGTAYASRTQESLRSDWRCFSAWCAEDGLRPFPASPATVIRYLEALAPDHRLSTLRRRLATLSHLHDALGRSNPTRDPAVKLTLRGLARSKGQRPGGRRAPLRQGDVEAILAAWGTSLRDCRDKALLLTARDSLARRAELARLAVADIEWRTSGDARAVLLRTKANSDGRSVWLAPETCLALKEWLARAGVHEGPVFRRIDNAGKVGSSLHPQSIARRFKVMARAAGLDAVCISGHSTRIGMCLDLVLDGQSLVAVQLAGGWVSPSMPARYAADLLPELGAVARWHGARGA